MSEIITGDPVLLFRALSEEVRLRILRILDLAEFSVQELTEILDAPQSTVSRHLARLREAELVSTRRQGTLVFYSRGPSAENGFGDLIGAALESLPGAEDDRAGANAVLERRRQASQSYFDAMAQKYSDIVEPGGSWRALAGALALGFDGRTVADIGAGDGRLTSLLAESAAEVFAVDSSREMVRLLKRKTRGVDNVKVRQGDFESLPLDDGVCDVVIASQTLHHCARPRKALSEAHRCLKRGGRLIVLDLVEHEQEWTREKLADHWLGFAPDELAAWAKGAGFGGVKVSRTPSPHEGLEVLTLTGRKAE